MPQPARKCSECPKSLRGLSSQAKTCSGACRSRRADRIKRAREKGGAMTPYDEQLQAANQAVRGKTKSAAHEVLKEELRPIVREALTDDVLKGLGDLVEMVPDAVALLAQQIQSADELVAQRAATLIMKYTLGNQAIAPASAEQAPAPMQVVFAMPRPGDAAPTQIEAQAEELVTCAECAVEQPKSSMVANSERCQACHDEVQARVAARFPKS